DSIGVGAVPHGKVSHVERLIWIRGRLSSESQKLLNRQPEAFHVLAEVFVHESRVEAVEPGGHWRVGRENAAGHRHLARFGPGETKLRHQHPRSFRSQKRRMSLVHVTHAWPYAQRMERPHSANAQHNLLLDAKFAVTAVQRAGDPAVVR